MDLVIRCAHLPSRGETIIADSSSEVPGGKGANQAVAAARVSGPDGAVTMIGRVGDDAFGKRLLDNLRRENVNTDAVRTTRSSPSGLAVVAVEESGENSIMVAAGANQCVTPGDVSDAEDLIRGADLLLTQLEIPVSSVVAAVAIASTAGVPVILNPAPMRASLPPELLQVDVICPNQGEAAAIVGRDVETVDDAIEAVAKLRDLGAASAIITLGSNGAVVGDSKEIRWIRPFEVTAVDTTAAGDAFAGALAVRLAEGAPLDEAARYACAAGACAATRHGAQDGMPGRLDIEQLLVHKPTNRSSTETLD